MSAVLRWAATRVLGLAVARYRWIARLTVVMSVLKWFVARRRRRAVVTLRRRETLVIGIDKAVGDRNGDRRVG